MSDENVSPRPAAGVRWSPNERKVAVRLGTDDLRNRPRGGIEVKAGTRALLFDGGRYVATLPPGLHQVEGLRDRPSAIVVDDGELGLELHVDGLQTSDDHRLAVHAEASIRLADPEVFAANLLRHRTSFSVGDLAEYLRGEARQTLREVVARYTADEINTGRVRAEIEMELLSSWKPSFDRSGFVLHRFRVLDFDVPGLATAGQVRSEVADDLHIAAARRLAREAYFEEELRGFRLDTEIERRRADAEDERETLKADVEMRELNRELGRLERRNRVLQRLQEERHLEEMTRLEGEGEWRRFRSRIDREHLLAEEELTELRRESEHRTAEAEARRKGLLERIRELARFDLEELKLQQERKLKLLEMHLDTEVIEEQARQERLRLDQELEARRRVAEQERFELEQVRKVQLQTLQELESVRQSGKDREASRQRQAETNQAELERLRLAQEAELFGGRSRDEILALAVGLHPERALEIAEVFRAAGSGDATERERELYERLLAEVKSAQERSQALDHEKFVVGIEAGTRHRLRREALDEQEKDRLAEVAISGLAGERGSIEWKRCPRHPEIKYSAQSGCPLCRQDAQ